MRPAEAALLPTRALQRELDPYLTPESAALMERQSDEPDRADFVLLCKGSAPYFIVRVPVPGRAGTIWVSRLPGIQARFVQREIDALERFGVTRIVCLVPTVSLRELHGAARYLDLASERFSERFHQVEIVDQQVPRDDEVFESVVAAIDAALRDGEQVLVHCVGGCGRSGTFVACLLTRTGMSPRDAIRRFRRQRRCGPETHHQVAYVYRYASRLPPPSAPETGTETETEIGTARPGTEPSPQDVPPPRYLVRLTGDGPLARGGLAAIHTGRLVLPGGGSRRVAIKFFRYGVDRAQAEERQRCIARLRRAGVLLPRMFMYELDGRWVQVTPLFGSRARGSKLTQPSLFYEGIGADGKRFAVDQLVRVTDAGYRPSMDLFVLFADGSQRIIPIDLDLITEEPSLDTRAKELLKLIIKLGATPEGRDGLLELAQEKATRELGDTLEALARGENSPFRPLWQLD